MVLRGPSPTASRPASWPFKKERATHHFRQQLRPHFNGQGSTLASGSGKSLSLYHLPSGVPGHDSQTESIVKVQPGFHHKAAQGIEEASLRFISLAFAPKKHFCNCF